MLVRGGNPFTGSLSGSLEPVVWLKLKSNTALRLPSKWPQPQQCTNSATPIHGRTVGTQMFRAHQQRQRAQETGGWGLKKPGSAFPLKTSPPPRDTHLSWAKKVMFKTHQEGGWINPLIPQPWTRPHGLALNATGGGGGGKRPKKV